MAETTTETEVSKNVAGPVITTENKSTDVLDSNGNSIGGVETPLSKIFDKVASGENAEAAVTEVMKPASKPKKQEAEVEKKEESVEEKKEEVVVEKTAPSKTEPVKEKEEKKEEVVPDEELQVLPHDKPKTAQRIAALLAKSSKAQQLLDDTTKQAAEKDKKFKELEEQLKNVTSADPLTNEKVKAHLDELAMYRRRYDLDNSDEVKQKFDGRVSASEDAIHKTLAAFRAPETLIAAIKEEGGWLKFSDSNRVIPLANGKEMPAAELAEAIKANLPLSERRKLESLELEQIQTKRDKETYFNEETKKAKDYFAQRDASAKQAEESRKKDFDTAVGVVKDWRTKFDDENKPKEVPANATAAEKASIQDHNEYVKQLRSVAEAHLGAKDVNGMLNVLNEAVKYHQERRSHAIALAKNKELQEALTAKQAELDRFKKAGSTTPKGGSLASGVAAKQEAERKAPPSLEDAFAALAEGKSLDNS